MNLELLTKQLEDYRGKIIANAACPPAGISISPNTAKSCGLERDRSHFIAGWHVTVRDTEDA